LRAPPAHRGAVVGGAAQLREEGDHVSVAATNGNGTATPWFVRGRTALVTGATRGIGLECAVALARAGMRVLLVGRDEERLAQAERTVRERGGSAQVESLRADFASLASVRALAAEVHARCPQLHVLVANAGGVHKTRELTVDGIEATFATNHLAHFLLTTELLDLLEASAPARVVVVSSIAHRQATMDLDDPGFAGGSYRIMRAYGRSKLANLLFTRELSRRLEGSGVTVNAVHPGAVATNIWSGAPLWARPLLFVIARLFMLKPEEGASRVVRLVTDPTLGGVSGRYFEDDRETEPAPLGRDDELAARLWDLSER